MRSKNFRVYTTLPNFEGYVDRFQMFRAISEYVYQQSLIVMNGEPYGNLGRDPENFFCYTLGDRPSGYDKIRTLKRMSEQIDSSQFNIIHDTFFAKLSLFHRKKYVMRARPKTRVVLSSYFPYPIFLARRGWRLAGEKLPLASDVRRFKFYVYASFREFVSYRIADGVICNSSEIAEGMITYYGLPEKKIKVLPTEIDTAYFTPPQSVEERFCRSPKTYLLLFVGSIIKRKGVETILKALPLVRIQVPNIKMLFVGPLWETQANWMEPDLKSGNLYDIVEFVGPAGRGELLKYYNLADLFIFPSLYEGSPRVIKEAAACGCPIVASRIPGIELLDPPKQYISFVDAGDYQQLAANICRLLLNSNERIERANQGLAYIRSQFSPSVIAEKTVEFYESLY